MAARINLVTLGVGDLAKATAFYEKLGFQKSQQASQESVTFMKAGGVVLGLWGRVELLADANLEQGSPGGGAVALAQNLESEEAVDRFIELAIGAGARLLKPAQKVFWGGYSGYFADPDGHVWEIAYNPFWPLAEDGLVKLPD